MSEIRRVYRKKTVLFLLVLCVINFALFLFSAAPDQEITLTGDDLTAYISAYPGFLARTAESGRTLAMLGMYKEGYAYEVLRKSTAAYESLEGLMPRGGDNRGIVLLLQYRITDLFLLAFLIILSADFLAERKKGLAGMVRSTLKGRGSLYLQRILILAFSAVLGAFLLYGGNYLGMLSAFGRTDLSRCIQSLPEYMKCPYNLTVGNYLFFSILLKAAGCFAAAAVFLLLVSFLGTATAYAGMGILAALEVLLNRLVIPVSSLNILRYLNLYTIISCDECFTDFCFINFFGRAVPAVSGILVFLALLVLLLAAAGFYIHGKLYVSGRQAGARILNKIAVLRERLAWQRSLFGWEVYKLFVKQGGLLMIAVLFAMHFYLSSRYDYSYQVDAYEKLMYLKYEGEITEESLQGALHEMDLLDERISRYTKLLNELMLEDPVDSQKMIALTSSLNEAKYMRAGLEPVLENMRGGMEYTERTGKTVMLIQPFTYDMLFLRDGKTTDRASLLILIGVIGAVSGIFAFDTENHMRDSIHTAYRGRRQTAALKLAVIFSACAVISVSLHMIQVWRIGAYLGYPNLSAPVQSLPFMRGFRPYVTILAYLVMLFGVRTLAAYGIGLLCGLVSRFSRDVVTALGISAFLFVIPTVFAEIIPGAHSLSTIYLLGGSYLRGAEIQAGKEQEAENVSEWVYVPEYSDIEFGDGFYNMKLDGDYVYYALSEEDRETGGYTLSMCKYSVMDGSTERFALEAEGDMIESFGLGADGSIYAVLCAWTWNEETQTGSAWHSLAKLDPSGGPVYQVDLTDIMAGEKADYINHVGVDGEGRVYLASENVILLFREDGSFAGHVSLNNMVGSAVSSMGRGMDGRVYICYGSFNCSLVDIDFERKKTGGIYENFPGGWGSMNRCGEREFLVHDSTSVYRYDCETETAEELFDWLDCDIDGADVYLTGMLSDGRIAAVSRGWDGGNGSLIVLTKKHISEVTQKETIVLAAMSGTYDLRAAVVRFNRANDQYRVVLKEYYNYDNYSIGGTDAWSDARTAMDMDLISDHPPDLIVLDGAGAEDLAQKNALEDLAPYLEAGAALKREDFVEHVLDGYTYNDRIVGLPKRFHIRTLVGRTSDVGAEMGWTQEEMTALSDANPGAELIDFTTKTNILYNSMKYRESEFVNQDTGECSFNSPEFIRLMKFAGRFADSVDYNSGESAPARIQKGNVLLADETVSSFRDLQLYRAMFGGDVTFIGFPTSDGRPGCEMTPDGVYGITAKSRNKEAAWAFIESCLTDPAKERWASGFPSLRRQLEEQLAEESAEEQKASVTYQDGWSYQYRAVCEEEAEQTLELIRASRPNHGVNSDITSIIYEEAQYFFNGAKSAEDAADIIQRRVQLYVNENR